MSTFKVEVVRVGQIVRHENSDFGLGQTRVKGYTFIVNTNDTKEDDLRACVPLDAHVPLDSPLFAFLRDKNYKPGDRHRVRAKKLRGIFSYGILIAAPEGSREGQDVAEQLGIIKYEPPPPKSPDNIVDPGFIVTYTNIETLRAYPDMLKPDEEVVVTEKIHGENARFVYSKGQLWCGSHTNIKADHPDSGWWNAARRYKLEEKLKEIPGFIIFGEVFGKNKHMRYGEKGKARGDLFQAFDVFNIGLGQFLDHQHAKNMVESLGLDFVPELYRGPYSFAKMEELAEGRSQVQGANHIREGIVIKPLRERFDDRVGRVILKMHSQAYLLKDWDSGEH
jgi:RNA ligase (TIGR02306 family)